MATKTVENAEYVAMVRRMVRGLQRRVADSDPDDLAQMVELAKELDAAIGQAVVQMRARHGFSWAQIGDAVGTSRQAAQMRWGKVVAS